MLKLLVGRDDVTDVDARRFELVSQVTKDAPPMFLVATAEDALTGMCAVPLVQRYASLGLPYEVHIYGHGPHGYSLANETTCDGSSRYLNPAFAQWQGLSIEWLYKIFGKLEFEDKSNSKMAAYLKEMGLELAGF